MIELMNMGGPVMWVLACVGLLAAIVFLERLLHLHRAQINTEDFLKGIYNILRRRNIVEAVDICEETPGPVAHIVRAAILHHDESRIEVERAVEEAGLAEIPRLEHNMGLLVTLAQISPLIGLFGTVLGMIDIFAAMEQQVPLVHAGDLAGGLWIALLTTAAGLAVGIPAYAAYNLLVGRVESILVEMERATIEILAFIGKYQLGEQS